LAMNSLALVGVVVASGGGLLNLLIGLVIVGLIWWVITWAMGKLPIPEPFKTVIWVILVLFIVIWLVNLLMGLSGHEFITW
jgi:hypothetical protein